MYNQIVKEVKMEDKQLEPFTKEWYSMIRENEGKAERMKAMSDERKAAYRAHIEAIMKENEKVKVK